MGNINGNSTSSGRQLIQNDPIALSVTRPRASRVMAGYDMGSRIAGFGRHFGFYLDLVEDSDVAARQDPAVYERMQRDAHYYACLQIRGLATASLPITMVPADQQPKATFYATEILDGLTGRDGMRHFTQFLLAIMQAIPQGLSVTEVVYKINKKLQVMPSMAFAEMKDRFVFDLDGNLCIRSPVDIFYGERVPDRVFVRHTFNPNGGSYFNPDDEARSFFGTGMNSIIYPWFIWKQLTLNMKFRYLDRFGSPTIIGRFPRKNAIGREQIMQMMNYLHTNGKMVWPSDDGYDVEFQEVGSTGDDKFQATIDYIDRQVSQAVLGSTLLLDQGDVGSYALGEVHERTTFGRISAFDRRAVEDTLNNGLIRWLMQLNHWNEDMSPSLSFQIKEQTELATTIEALQTLQGMGFQISAELVTEKTGFRQPRPGETILMFDPMGAAGGSQQIDGPNSPLAGVDMLGTGGGPENGGKPKPVEKFAFPFSGEKFQTLPCTPGGKIAHVHYAKVDRKGNGLTTADAGHKHEVRSWKVMTNEGHNHSLMGFQQNTRHIAEALAG